MVIWGASGQMDDIWRWLIVILVMPFIYQKVMNVLYRIFQVRPGLASGFPLLMLLTLIFLLQLLLYAAAFKGFHLLTQHWCLL